MSDFGAIGHVLNSTAWQAVTHIAHAGSTIAAAKAAHAVTEENPLNNLSTASQIVLGVGVCAAFVAIDTTYISWKSPATASSPSWFQRALAPAAGEALPFAGLLGVVTAVISKSYRTAGIAAAVLGLGGGLLLWKFVPGAAPSA